MNKGSWSLLLILAGIGCGQAQVQAQPGKLEWPQFRGPGGVGAFPQAKVPDWKKQAWKKELPGKGTSSPILLGEKIYLTCYKGDANQLTRLLVCLKRADGELLWSKEVPSKLPEQGRIREDHGYASSTLATDGTSLFAFFGKSGVFAFDLEGKQLWQADVGSKLDGFGSGSSPTLFEDLVIVNASVESDSLVALDKKSGKEKWRAGGIVQSWNTPALVPQPNGGQPELVVGISKKILGLNPRTGEQLWSCNTEHYWYIVPTPVSQDGIVYCLGGRGDGTALAIKTGGKGDVTKSQRQWLVRKTSNVSSPIVHNGHVYFINDAQCVAYCLEAASGKVVYEERIPGASQVYASPVLLGDKIFYLDRMGKLFVVPAAPRFEVIDTVNLSDRTIFNASPVPAGNRLLIRSDRYLYCLGE